MPSGVESGPPGGPVFEPLTVFRAERVCKTTTASLGQFKYFSQKKQVTTTSIKADTSDPQNEEHKETQRSHKRH